MSGVKTHNLRDSSRVLITSSGELPDFDSLTPEQEAEFWETHDFAEGVLEEGPEIEAEVYKALGVPNFKK